MRSVPPPTVTVADALAACIPHIANPALVAKLKQIAPLLDASEANYRLRAPIPTLFELQPQNHVGVVTGAEMRSLYGGTFARRKTRSRAIYDALKQGAINGICPLCGAQQVASLDHHLAKAFHPALAITPINLVPACSDCNKAKLDFQAANAAEQPIHPYFDDIDDERWLFADVIQQAPASLLYRVDPPSVWEESKRERVRRHFMTLKLANMFASQSSDHIPSLKGGVGRIHAVLGAEGVRKNLLESLADCLGLRTNSWQIAMFEALAASDWYCDGGFSI